MHIARIDTELQIISRRFFVFLEAIALYIPKTEIARGIRIKNKNPAILKLWIVENIL